MKKNYFFATLFLIYSTLTISQNIFSNGDFENYYNCPNTFGQSNLIIGCVNSHDTPDYYNCTMYPGYANTGTGSVYLGSVKYASSVTHEGVNFELDTPLEINREYTIKIAVNYGSKYHGTGFIANQYLGCYTLRFDFSMSSANTGIPNSYSYELDTENVQTNENTTYYNYTFTFTPTEASEYLYIVTTPTTKTMSNDPECLGTVFYNLIDNLSIVPTDLLSTETYNLDTFSMYPNPVKDKFQIKLHNDTINSVLIYNVVGKEVKFGITKTNNGKTAEIDFSNLANGLYFVKINNTVKKFLKITT
ncbi:T9SS type A sorting domain-containing protein [Aurantibacter sp.]|uniref:T9SS type A sorting domain-containing protein n=1 Tax=Aurantibacter sp. TaxID=2807103 RepID=UPI0035C7BA7D